MRLLRVEIFVLAKRLILEINESRTAKNDSVKASPVYREKLKQIEGSSVLNNVKAKVEKTLKNALGDDWKDQVNFNLTQKDNSSVAKIEKAIIANRIKLNSEMLLPLLDQNFEKYHLDDNKDYNKIVDAITISQINLTNVEDIVNEVKKTL